MNFPRAVFLGFCFAQSIRVCAEEIPVLSGLALAPAGQSRGRVPVRTDPVEALIVSGKWRAPAPGDVFAGGTGRFVWEGIKANERGEFTGHRALTGGYLFAQVNANRSRTMMLEASGHGMVYVNGVPCPGDPYRNGTLSLPVKIRAGLNDLLFQGGRGSLSAKLIDPPSSVYIDLRDTTTPHVVQGKRGKHWAAILVVNTTDRTLSNLELLAGTGDERIATKLGPIPPMTVRKARFQFQAEAGPEDKTIDLGLVLRARNESPSILDIATLPIEVAGPKEARKVTFISEIDGSVQYYALLSASGTSEEARSLVLSLHGASVEAIGQARAYSARPWASLVAPTNRRPYGFDWEDWGRLDAIEVLEQATKLLRPDPRRIYLTGHSMGGHGTWHVGGTFPDRFAAIAPSAGWVSFRSFAGGLSVSEQDSLERMMLRATSPSDTLARISNHRMHGVYVLHGDADDNVPVREARTMRQHLEPILADFGYHEQPGAGHWWDANPEPGADCVDWAPMWDLFARRVLPEVSSLREIDFTTASPGVSSRAYWLEILQQERPLEPSRAQLRCDPLQGRISGTTANIASLSLNLSPLAEGSQVHIELDGQKLGPLGAAKRRRVLSLRKRDGRWEVAAPPLPGHKNPNRYGPFKEAFRHQMLFVYGTGGAPEENAWALVKARFDAEAWRYRGNGSVDVVADTDPLWQKSEDRGIVLYGNAETNRAWPALLERAPFLVTRGAVRVGDRLIEGSDLAGLFAYPRPGSATAMVAVVAGTGLEGCRLLDRMPYFTSGVAYPDWTVLGADALETGLKGVRGCGFFTNEWAVSRDDTVWSKLPERSVAAGQ